MPSMNRSRREQSGQALMEYAIVGLALTLALFVADFGGRTGAQHLVDMVRAFFLNLSFFFSLP